MTLDEAIKHAEEVAEEHTKYNRYGGFESCDEYAKEHRQLAEWLRDYKRIKEETELCKDAVSRKEIQQKINRLWNSNGDKDYCMETLRDFVTELSSVTLPEPYKERSKND